MSRNNQAIDWTPEMIRTVRTERAAGFKWEAIAAQVGVTLETLRTFRRRMAAQGVNFPGEVQRLLTPETRQNVARLIGEGQSYYAVADRFGVDPDTVAKWAKNMGIMSRRARALQVEPRT